MAEDAVLGYLDKGEIPDSGTFAEDNGFNHDEIVNVIKRLQGYGYVDVHDIKRERWMLTDEGKRYAKSGSPEFQLFSALPAEGISKEDLQKNLDPSVYKIGGHQAVKNKWVEMDKTRVSRKIPQVLDKVKNLLVLIQNEERVISPEDIDGLKRRKLIVPKVWTGYSVKKGPNYAPKRKKVVNVLTSENMSGWKDVEFKEYNVNATRGQPLECGSLHSLLKVKEGVEKIFQSMGFEQMEEGISGYVESSFYNFDATFQQQKHPARDSHDTFYLKQPCTTRSLPEEYVEKVKNVHENGGYGSLGHRCGWSLDEARKNILRTHTTVVSTRILHQLAQKPSTPKRYYSIQRVFRNEAVDRTHLAEFHQIEGMICDKGLGLGHLKGILQEFFTRLGMTKLKFKPAYNPYTSPSMEILSYHEGLKKWVEIGNSGMFRPEMLRPMGFPEDVSVIAFGLSLERPTMIMYDIDNIRHLFGHKVDLQLIKKNPICRIGCGS